MVETIVFEHIRDVFWICETYSTYSVYARRILYMRDVFCICERTERTEPTFLSLVFDPTFPCGGLLFLKNNVPFSAWCSVPTFPCGGPFFSEKQRPFFSLVFGAHVPLRGGLFFWKTTSLFSLERTPGPPTRPSAQYTAYGPPTRPSGWLRWRAATLEALWWGNRERCVFSFVGITYLIY